MGANEEETANNKAQKLLILCFFNPTVKGTWIDQKVQKNWAHSEKQHFGHIELYVL